MAGQQAFEPSESVQIVAARTIKWQPTTTLVGTIVSLRSVGLMNELPGVVTSVRFKSGDIVDAGQILVTQDDSADQAEMATAVASVKLAKAGLEVNNARIRLAEVELSRLEAAARDHATSAIELDRARSELDKARAEQTRILAEIALAEARVAQVKTRIDKLTLRAPFKARVGIRSVHEGQFLAPSMGMPGVTPVVLLEEVSDNTYLDFTIPQDYAPRVFKGAKVAAASPILGKDPVQITIEALDAGVNNATRNIRVRAIIDNPLGILRPGMFIPISVPIDEERSYTVVPATAVRKSSFADMVFVIAPGQKPDELRAQQRFVTIGSSVGQDVIILDGLKPGESVAATGAFKLRDGALVVKAQPPAGNPAATQPPSPAADASKPSH